ncbi:MAG: ribosomal small subunit methyltransferase [Deinococcota bacterium]|jgi:16S rRNA (cytidine1402-2'-O)-methyltransferase
MTERIVYLVPTPIGNLGDITLRALETLKNVDCIACEDTRHSGRLLQHFGIHKPLERLDAHTMLERAKHILEKYARVAFVSDAGSPGLSDPGAELVSIALEMGIRIEALPGANALIPAITLSGLPSGRFGFHGFLPRSGRERTERLEEISISSITSVLYESPHRIHDTLLELKALCGTTRECAVARELSKLHEEVFRGTLETAAQHFSGEVKGEIVLILAPNTVLLEPTLDYTAKALEYAKAGLRVKEIRAKLQQLGLERNAAYDLALKVVSQTRA